MVLDLLLGTRNVRPKFNKRSLEERSHLLFEFPQPNGRAYRAYVPMLENCRITESQRANLQEYSLLSRSSSIYAYLGAKSRNFTLTFNITFLNLLELMGKEGLSDKFTQHFTMHYASKQAQKEAFFNLARPDTSFAQGVAQNIRDFKNNPGGTKVGRGVDHAKLHRSYYQKVANVKTQNPSLFDSGIDAIFSFLGVSTETEDSKFKGLNKQIDLIVFWINLIRSSVKNNSSDTTLGCPIVRLTHGILYNNVPCIAENYSIRIVEEAGYDIQTMLPKQLEVTMALSEHRVGDFGEFKSSNVVQGDNHVGWEAVLGSNNTDPYTGVVKLSKD
jgi:hypothetical protein